jgi:hypothetical protein
MHQGKAIYRFLPSYSRYSRLIPSDPSIVGKILYLEAVSFPVVVRMHAMLA